MQAWWPNLIHYWNTSPRTRPKNDSIVHSVCLCFYAGQLLVWQATNSVAPWRHCTVFSFCTIPPPQQTVDGEIMLVGVLAVCLPERAGNDLAVSEFHSKFTFSLFGSVCDGQRLQSTHFLVKEEMNYWRAWNQMPSLNWHQLSSEPQFGFEPSDHFQEVIFFSRFLVTQ